MPQPGINAYDIAACSALLRDGSRSFYAASLLLPGKIRKPATALYAFCRIADDAIDLGADPQAAIVELNARLDAVYAGAPAPSPIDRAFAAAVAACQIPKLLPASLIEGLAWDSQGRRYETFPALLDYAARVAGAVGVMMALVMGVRDAASLARAGDLGVAMQLTNIARDVGEDAKAGRLFLPRDWLADAGIEPESLLNAPEFSPALGQVVHRLLEEADQLYRRAESGIARLPLGCRAGIAAARRIYAAIGTEVATNGYDSITRRARVSGKRKFLLAGRAVADAILGAADFQHPVLPANQFLIVAATPPGLLQIEAEPTGYAWIMALFERLERTQRENTASPDGRLA